MIIFGGFVNGIHSNEIFEYNIETKEWNYLKPESDECPVGRVAHSAVLFENEMYIFGGLNEEDERGNDLWKFNLETYKWTQLETENLPPVTPNSQNLLKKN
jgi:leucine-zipper-like transcriptional regulator 1